MECVIVFLKSDKVKNKVLEKYENIIDVNDKNLFSYIKRFEKIKLYFHFEENDVELEKASYFIKKLKEIVKFAKKHEIQFESLIEGKDCFFLQKNIVTSINALKINNKNERIEFLYTETCRLLDEQFIENNLCGFKNNKCFAKKDTNRTMGCCHHYDNKKIGVIWQKELKLCEYQKDKHCTADCITCKMFVCDEIKKKGFYFTVNNVLTIKHFFNQTQKLIIKISFFTQKEKILKRLKIAKLSLI